MLNDSNYVTECNAPLSFNVIDIFNLTDHVEALNVLMTASSLLSGSLSATLNMESIVRQKKDHEALIDSLLCDHFATLFILFGLFPVEY